MTLNNFGKFSTFGKFTYMPLEKLHSGQDRAWALWRISEPADELLWHVRGIDAVPTTVTKPAKQLEHVAGRVLVSHLMQHLGLRYQGIRKDEFGKPYALGHHVHLSVSHSYPYVAAVVDKQQLVGIDLEQPKDKLLRVAPRVLHPTELADAGTDPVKHCVLWCAKEAMIKIYGKKDLVLAQNLRVEPFKLGREGHILGRIIVNGIETRVPLQYFVNNDFVVALNT
jgi:4'-phosphopantetheinyl transferase